MPLVYIHGVNTRMSETYRKEVVQRNDLFRKYFLVPFAEVDSRFRDMSQRDPVNPYWGDFGARPRWNHATLPLVNALNHLGADDKATSAEMESSLILGELAGPAEIQEGAHSNTGFIQTAALKDLPRFMEAILAPIIHGSQAWAPEFEVPLLITADEVARDVKIHVRVANAASDEEVLQILSDEVTQRYQHHLTDEGLILDQGKLIEGLGILGNNPFENLKQDVQDLFHRASNLPSRATTLRALEEWRENLNRHLWQFFGDAFVYLNERGDNEKPGPIIRVVLDAITQAVADNPNEPLIVVTHSMGGNIFYDILTYFAPHLAIDTWISVGGQVGQFEEIKLFRASDQSLGLPNRVPRLQPQVKRWLNLYDPADPFSFLTEPVFEGASDHLFKTDASAFKAHNAYFLRPRFYYLLREYFMGELS